MSRVLQHTQLYFSLVEVCLRVCNMCLSGNSKTRVILNYTGLYRILGAHELDEREIKTQTSNRNLAFLFIMM